MATRLALAKYQVEPASEQEKRKEPEWRDHLDIVPVQTTPLVKFVWFNLNPNYRSFIIDVLKRMPGTGSSAAAAAYQTSDLAIPGVTLQEALRQWDNREHQLIRHRH